MSRFYGTFSSDCTKDSTKRGHNYVHAHVRGWEIGVITEVNPCRFCGADHIIVTETSGSSGDGQARIVHERCLADCQK